LSLLVAAGVPAAAGGGQELCGPSEARSTTLARTPVVRAYYDDIDGAWYACAPGGGRPVLLAVDSGSSSGQEWAQAVHARGRFVAWQHRHAWPSQPGEPVWPARCAWNDVRVLDMRTRRSRVVWRLRSCRSVHRIEMKANGSLAWIDERRVGGPWWTVRRVDRRGRRVLDSGVGSRAPHTLRLEGSRLTWLVGTTGARSATLR
jgi:hypothetical protein